MANDTDPKYNSQLQKDEHDNSANIKAKRVILFGWNPTSLQYERLLSNSGVLLDSNSVVSSVALSSPPTALTVSADTSFTFSSQVKHIFIQNNTAYNLNIEFDATATAGSILLMPGQYISLDIPATVIHLLSSNASNVNGTTGNNIVLKGWS